MSPSPKRNAQNSPRRLTLYFQDDAVRARSLETVQSLLTSATSSDATSTTVLLARKALKYRKVYDRMSGVDVTSPAFDACEFLGFDWQKTTSLKTLPARAV